MPLFSRCTNKELAAIAGQADELAVGEGRTLTTEGRRGHDFVVIVEGAAEVRKKGRKVATLGPGDFLGEIALLTGAPRVATVTTTAPSRLLVVTDRAFRQVLLSVPDIQTSLLRALSERLEAGSL